jgi:hypothetical protein
LNIELRTPNPPFYNGQEIVNGGKDNKSIDCCEKGFKNVKITMLKLKK